MFKLIKRISDVAKKKTAKKATKKKTAKKATKKKTAKKATKKKTAKKATKKKVAKKATKKKTAKKATKKKTAKKATKKKTAKKATKKKTAKKATKKKTAKKATNKKAETKAHDEVKVEKLKAAPVPSEKTIYEPETNDNEELNEIIEPKPSNNEEAPNHLLADEYNPDDESDSNAFGYGWSYDEGLDSPEEVEKEEEPYDEDAEYASSGKPVGYDLEAPDDDKDDDMY